MSNENDELQHKDCSVDLAALPESFLWLVPLQRCSASSQLPFGSTQRHADLAVANSRDTAESSGSRINVHWGTRINFWEPSSQYVRAPSISTATKRTPTPFAVSGEVPRDKQPKQLTLPEQHLALPANSTQAPDALITTDLANSFPSFTSFPVSHRILPTEPPNVGTSFGAQHASLPTSHYQIVLYRDRRMVVYDPGNRHLGVRALSPNEEAALRSLRLSHCPMCGQAIDPSKFSFEAQSYFRLLHDIIQNRIKFSERSPPATAEYGFRTTGFGWRHVLPFETGEQTPELSTPLSAREYYENPFVSDELRHREAGKSEEFLSVDESEGSASKSVLTGMCITGYYSSFFREIRRLGTGSYGQVYLCHHLLDDVFLGEYAAKKVPVGQDRQWLQAMLREVKIRERLHHANIVEYKHSWLEMHRTSPHLPLIPWLFVLMEFCNGGDLDNFLAANGYVIGSVAAKRNTSVPPPRAYMEESHIWKLFLDISSGLNHLHHSGILHRDLKPQNILLQCTLDNLTQRPTTTALLSDFGTAELIADRASERHGFTGTVEYTAPELLETDDKGHFREDYDEKSDIWSLGVVLFVMAYGFVPYINHDPQRCRLEILTHTDPRLIIPATPERSSDLVLLIEALLQRVRLSMDPDARPSLDTILQHPRIRRRLADVEGLAEAGLQLAYLLSRARNHPTSTTPPPPAAPGAGALETPVTLTPPCIHSAAALEPKASPLVLMQWPNTTAENKQSTI